MSWRTHTHKPVNVNHVATPIATPAVEDALALNQLSRLSINQEPISTTKRDIPDSRSESSPRTESVQNRRTLRSESAEKSDESRRGLKPLDNNDGDLEMDYDSEVARLLYLNYRSVSEFSKDDSYSEEEGELGEAQGNMKASVEAYQTNPTDETFERMMEHVAAYTSLENDSVVERNIDEMVEEAYKFTFENPEAVSKLTGTETIMPWVGIPEQALRDFSLVLIREGGSVYLKLSARNLTRSTSVTDKTWTVSGTNESREQMKNTIMATLEDSGAVRTEDQMKTTEVAKAFRKKISEMEVVR